MKLILFILLLSFKVLAKSNIYILPFSEVEANKPVRLGLIADNPQANLDFDRIYDEEIFEPKKAGQKYFLGQVEIARVLQDKFGKERDIAFHIPSQVVIQAKANLIPKPDVLRWLNKTLLAKFPEHKISIKDLRVPEVESHLSMESWSLEEPQGAMRGPVLVPLKLYFSNSQTPKSLWISAQIKQEKSVLVARKNLKLGDALVPDDYESKVMDVTFQQESSLRFEDTQNKILAKFIRAGQVLMAGDLKKEPGVLRGQTIKVLTGTDDFEVTMTGTAEEPGAIGDLVRLKVNDSQKLISGKVVEKGIVRIQ